MLMKNVYLNDDQMYYKNINYQEKNIPFVNIILRLSMRIITQSL